MLLWTPDEKREGEKEKNQVKYPQNQSQSRLHASVIQMKFERKSQRFSRTFEKIQFNISRIPPAGRTCAGIHVYRIEMRESMMFE